MAGNDEITFSGVASSVAGILNVSSKEAIQHVTLAASLLGLPLINDTVMDSTKFKSPLSQTEKEALLDVVLSAHFERQGAKEREREAGDHANQRREDDNMSAQNMLSPESRESKKSSGSVAYNGYVSHKKKHASPSSPTIAKSAATASTLHSRHANSAPGRTAKKAKGVVQTTLFQFQSRSSKKTFFSPKESKCESVSITATTHNDALPRYNDALPRLYDEMVSRQNHASNADEKFDIVDMIAVEVGVNGEQGKTLSKGSLVSSGQKQSTSASQVAQIGPTKPDAPSSREPKITMGENNAAATNIDRRSSRKIGTRTKSMSIPDSFVINDIDVLSNDFDAKALAQEYRDDNLLYAPFLHLCQALSAVCSTSKRLAKQQIFINVLLAFLYHDRQGALLAKTDDSDKEHSPSSYLQDPRTKTKMTNVLISVLLAGNSGSDGLTLFIGGGTISNAICSAFSCTKTNLRQRAGDAGELGDAAAQLFAGEGSSSTDGRKTQKQTRLAWGKQPEALSVGDMMKCLLDLHHLSQSGAGENKGVEQKRKDTIAALLSRARHKEEVRFAIKILCSHVRTGATLITLVTCLSAAAVLCEKGMVRWSPVEDSTRTKGETSKLNSKKSAKKAKTGTREVKKQTRTGSNDEQDDKEDTRQQPLYATTNELDSGETQFGSLKEEVMQAQQELRLIYSRHNDLKSIVSAVVSGGFAEVRQQCQVKVGVPLQPMLASPSRGVEDVASHFQQFYDKHKPHPDDTSPHKSHCNPFVTAEYKYDGQRVQIHFSRVVADSSAIDGGKVESPSQNKVVLYSRNLEDVTGKFKPVCDWLLLSMPEQITSCILDAEICAVKRQKHDTTKSEQEVETHIEASILPFQVLSTMKRDDPGDLLVVSKGSQSSDGVGLCMFAFDLLLLNNEPLVDETLSIRRQKNRDAFTPMIRHGYFHFTRSIDISFSKEEIADATSQVEPFLMESIGEGRCEGLMLKSLHSTYDGISRELGGGAGSWRKLKKDYIDSLADSIDVVPIGAWRGTGRKNKWFSPFLLAVYDKSTGEWQSLCRCMSGFSDEFYQAKLDQFSPHIVPDKPDDVSTNEQAPYWFDPWKIREVWEIRGADLTLSPVHHAARGFADESFESDRGIALRFPRFIRVRDDKNIEQSSTSEDVVTLFRNQSQRQ